MQNKLVSIAMATYNGEKYLKEQLDSIYAQTYKDIEVIVCDDCSSDKTVEILDEYKEKYGLKYYINEKNLGFKKSIFKSTEKDIKTSIDSLKKYILQNTSKKNDW